MPRLVQPLPPGPLAIVGDVHGEIDALEALLSRLGVSATRSPRGLVFVGDLVDRGPDSLAVLRRVRGLVEAGLAWVVAGNHELNLLNLDKKEGNGWFFGDEQDHAQVEGLGPVRFDSRPATAPEREEVLAFCRSLPLLLQREDLRVVHACDDPWSLAQLPESGELAELDAHFAQRLRQDLADRGVHAQALQERARYAGLKAFDTAPQEHLHAVAEEDAALQNLNPIKVLTSGAEREVALGEHFWVGGKWRFVNRDRWWSRRGAPLPTVVGHYWRRRGPGSGRLDVWDELPPFAWCRQVFCVDYSVGRRYAERARGLREGFQHGLAALCWPERVLVWDDQDERTPTLDLGV